MAKSYFVKTRSPIRCRVASVNSADIDQLNAAIRDVPDFPKEGIVFKDITPVLGDPVLFRLAIDGLIEAIDGQSVALVTRSPLKPGEATDRPVSMK